MMACIMKALCLSLAFVKVYAEINQLKHDLLLFLEQALKSLSFLLVSNVNEQNIKSYSISIRKSSS